MRERDDVRIHPTAEVSDQAEIGPGTRIWNQCQVREGVRIGRGCILSKDVYVDAGVQIGDYCKIQNGVSLYHGVTLADGVFCGPHMIFTNDREPRAINADGTPKGTADWTVSPTHIGRGAALGAGCLIVCGVTVGDWALVGAGAVVTRDVPAYGLVYGNPARLRGFVSPRGRKMSLAPAQPGGDQVALLCPESGEVVLIPRSVYAQLRSE